MPEIPDRNELLELLAERARDGHVQAIKLLLEEQRRDDDDEGTSESGIAALYAEDELAKRRKSA